jgi:pyruvate kinase
MDARDGFRSLEEALDRVVLDGLAAEVEALRSAAWSEERTHSDLVEQVDPVHRTSARNLLHYLAIRRHDIRDLQDRLARAGLSSLGRSEAHVLASLERVSGLLALARGLPLPEAEAPPVPVGFRGGPGLLAANATALLGPPRTHRPVRIMVTLPTEAAQDAELVEHMLAAGMDCARVNTAHDDPECWQRMIDNVDRARRRLGTPCRIVADLPGPKLRTGQPRVDGVPTDDARVETGARFKVVADSARPAPNEEGLVVPVEVPSIFDDLAAGQALWIDDGKIWGRVSSVAGESAEVEVVRARPGGTRVRKQKGINLPDTRLRLPALSEQDRRHALFAARQADVVSLSFVHDPQDVADLREVLRQAGAPGLGILLKIETRAGFECLPRILLEAMGGAPYGVMIARGDLAVEAGFSRLAEVQEEILWIAEAAHAPTVWATQVLEGLAKKGVPTRAEVTDAAMGGRAEAVMLNKGPHVVEAIRALDDILGRMASHQAKKVPLLRPLNVAKELDEPGGRPDRVARADP